MSMFQTDLNSIGRSSRDEFEILHELREQSRDPNDRALDVKPTPEKGKHSVISVCVKCLTFGLYG
jgi:hypothetical protein